VNLVEYVETPFIPVATDNARLLKHRIQTVNEANINATVCRPLTSCYIFIHEQIKLRSPDWHCSLHFITVWNVLL